MKIFWKSLFWQPQPHRSTSNVVVSAIIFVVFVMTIMAISPLRH